MALLCICDCFTWEEICSWCKVDILLSSRANGIRFLSQFLSVIHPLFGCPGLLYCLLSSVHSSPHPFPLTTKHLFSTFKALSKAKLMSVPPLYSSSTIQEKDQGQKQESRVVIATKTLLKFVLTVCEIRMTKLSWKMDAIYTFTFTT